MLVLNLRLKNFRCFNDVDIRFNKSVSIITGSNGSGKTSLLEALHYGCYLKSFRTHAVKDLINLHNNNFFILITFVDNEGINRELSIGFSGKKRIIKLDSFSLKSYKELINYYRAVTITEDDLMLIKGGPEGRRVFLDQALLVHDAQYLPLLRFYKQILHNRNALLQQHSSVYDQSYEIWTQKLWEQSVLLRNARQEYISTLQHFIEEIIDTHFSDQFSFVCTYFTKNKIVYESFEQFFTSIENVSLFEQERLYGRSLFGAHLDDVSMNIFDKSSKVFASRGQQKLSIFLLKIAQLKYLQKTKGLSLILLDDFMSDFDKKTSILLFKILKSLSCQLIFTSPLANDFLQEEILSDGGEVLTISGREI